MKISANLYGTYNFIPKVQNKKPAFCGYDAIISEGLPSPGHRCRSGIECYYSPTQFAKERMSQEEQKVSDLETTLKNKKQKWKNLSIEDRNLLKTHRRIKNSELHSLYMAGIDENKATEIFNRSKEFGVNEYANLTKSELEILRKVTSGAFDDDEDILGFVNFVYQMDRTQKIGAAYSKKLDELYPNGYTLVTVGRSPSLLGKYLEFQGKDVKYVPISNIREVEIFPSAVVQNYKNYFDSIGLTKEFIDKSETPIVITDFVDSGLSMKNFEKLLAHPEIGILASEKVQFLPMNRKYQMLNGESSDAIFSPLDKNYPAKAIDYTIRPGMSDYNDLYSPIPWFGTDRKESIVEVMKDYNQRLSCKKMLFCIIDALKG